MGVKKNTLKFILLVIIFITIGMAVIFGYEKSYDERYFESFRFVTLADQTKEIHFINELKPSQLKNKWYIKVSFHGKQWAFFKNYNQQGKLYEEINNDLSLTYKVQKNNSVLKN